MECGILLRQVTLLRNKKSEPIKSTYFIHDTSISDTVLAKYLEAVIDTNLKWTKQ